MKTCRSLVSALCMVVLWQGHGYSLPQLPQAVTPQYQQLFSLPTGVATISAMAVDPAGNIYLTGSTQSTALPTTPGAFQTAFGGGTCYAPSITIGPGDYFPCYDAFVIKLDPTGKVIYC